MLAVLSWLTLPGHLLGSGRFPFEQPKQLHGHLPGSGGLSGILRYMQGVFFVAIYYRNPIGTHADRHGCPSQSLSLMCCLVTRALPRIPLASSVCAWLLV